MRKTLSLAIGTGAAAAAAIMVAGLASAASGTTNQGATTHQTARPAAAAAAMSRLISKAQAVRIAEAKVPHSRAIEIESDDLHDRAVWKVTLATSHGRVIVSVDKRTGHATILGHGGSGGTDDTTVMTRHSVRTHTAAASTAGWSGRDAREHARDRADQADRDQGDRDRGDHGRGDQGGHRDHHRGDQREAERGDR